MAPSTGARRGLTAIPPYGRRAPLPARPGPSSSPPSNPLSVLMMSMNGRGILSRLALGAFALLGAIVACDSAGGGPTEPAGQPASLEKVAGDEQAVTVGASL